MESRKLKKIPAFFKPFVAEDRERRLLIPPFFSEFMKDRLPNNAIIRDRKENYWPVEVLQREKKKFFEAGWTKFVQDKNVQYGDFLVFEYDGGSFFDVRILESWHVRRNLVLKVLRQTRWKRKKMKKARIM
nr:PREDICTED: putative B3 domain-containing protein At5g66980 [Daucus carota subsp. sativus]